MLVGAILANLTNLYDPATNPDIGQPLLLSASPGVAATLQSLLGYYLVKPRVNLETGLVDSAAILRLLIFGGPVACMLGASRSVATLYLGAVIHSADLLFNWVTWWAGDSIGVMLGTPLLLIWLARPRESWEHRKAGVALPVFVAFAVVLTIYLVKIREHEELIETRFESQAEFLGNSLEKEIRHNFEMVYSLQGLSETAESVEDDEFRRYVDNALTRNPGIHALSWNPVVARAHRREFEASMKARGFAGFRISERDDSGELVPAGPREFHVVVQYIEPLEANRKALGFGVFSNRHCKLALRRAHDSGELTGTEPITLVQESGDQAGVLFMLPVLAYPSESSRQAAVAELPSGYVVGVFRIGSLLMQVLEGNPMKNVVVRLQDIDDASMPKPLGEYLVTPQGLFSSETRVGADSGTLYWRKPINLGNRGWLLEVQAGRFYL